MYSVQELKTLIADGDLVKLERCLTQNPELTTYIFPEKSSQTTLLLLAVEHLQLEKIALLIERGASCVSQPRNPLSSYFQTGYRGYKYHNRSDSSHIEVLKLLVANGASYPLEREADCAWFLQSELNEVCNFDDVEVARTLVALGFDLVAIEKTGQISLLSLAIRNRWGERMKMTNLFRYLVDLGCDVTGYPHRYYGNPLWDCLQSGLYACAELLLDKGASTNNLKSDFLVELPRLAHEGLETELLDRLTQGMDFNKVDRYGVSPLHSAAGRNHARFIEYFASRGADLKAIDGEGRTPLFVAIQNKSKDAINSLITLGVELNGRNAEGKTALDVALSLSGFKRVCASLQKAGAKTSAELDLSANPHERVLAGVLSAFKEGEPWADRAREKLGSLSTEHLQLWHELARHCLEFTGSKPTNRWMKLAGELVDKLGADEVRACLLLWFPLVKETRSKELPYDEVSEQYSYGDQRYYISENNTRLLRGLAWVSSRFADPDMSRELRMLAANMYKKVYGIGMRNSKLANAALYALSQMPGDVGVKEIVVLRAATKYNPALVNINRVFGRIAEERGVTADELAALAVPDYGLTSVGGAIVQVGEYQAVLQLTSVGKTELSWRKGEKLQKAVPSALKQTHGDEIRAIKAMANDVQVGSRAHSQRLEALYLSNKSLDIGGWQEQYMDHPLVGFLARRLIWRITTPGGVEDIFYRDGHYINAEGEQVTLPKEARVLLWHPSMSSAEEVKRWRDWLLDAEITQPFKQAHREIYLLTDAERHAVDHSMRYANHILLHTQFHALAEQRGWEQVRGGSWDGGQDNAAGKNIPAYGVSVSYRATGLEQYGYTDSGIYTCVGTGAVRFYRNNERMRVEDVDPMLFSEVMRDIDLFVGVAGVGNDPSWQEREDVRVEDHQYWQASSFGELSQIAQTRKEVLQRLIPKLKIARQLRLDGRFLVVEGKLRTYKIHLGSTNILMEPNDSYLCIVALPSKNTVMLPFEGDSALSLLLSKAMLLANDEKITDPVIVAQINRREVVNG